MVLFNRYKAEPQFSAVPNTSASENDPEPGFPETGKDVPELEEKVRGPATLLTTGFRQGKEMFLVLYTTKLVIFKDESHFNVRVGHQIRYTIGVFALCLARAKGFVQKKH